MKALLCGGVIFAFALSGIRAENAPAPISPKTSAFKIEASARNPFWPIGYHPTDGNGSAQAGPEIPPTAFSVTSIVIDDKAKFAIVNGKTMQEGQHFALQMGSQIYQLTLKSIEDGQIIVQGNNESIVVPLRRR